jgi:hypothetical protein
MERIERDSHRDNAAALPRGDRADSLRGSRIFAPANRPLTSDTFRYRGVDGDTRAHDLPLMDASTAPRLTRLRAGGSPDSGQRARQAWRWERLLLKVAGSSPEMRNGPGA